MPVDPGFALRGVRLRAGARVERLAVFLAAMDSLLA
jgi:hypothetical protein